MKARERAPWYLRMKRTAKLKTRLAEILREWPCDGSETTDTEQDVDDAYKAWHRDMGNLPEQESTS